MRHGWYQLAFERELKPGLTPIDSRRPLVALRTRKGVRVFDAVCPHRGAHLGFGGRPDGDAVVCPFHGHRIGIGMDCETTRYKVKEYQTFVIGGMLFACLSDEHEHGFRAMMQGIDRDHYFMPGFEIIGRMSAELVIENGFDSSHFKPVHSIHNRPSFTVAPTKHGEFGVNGVFVVPTSEWQVHPQEGWVSIPYRAFAHGPGTILTHMGGENPYWVITCATPTTSGGCIVRLSIAVPPPAIGGLPDPAKCEYLLRQCRKGLEKDITIWNHLNSETAARFEPEDEVVLEFRKYLAGIEDAKQKI